MLWGSEILGDTVDMEDTKDSTTDTASILRLGVPFQVCLHTKNMAPAFFDVIAIRNKMAMAAALRHHKKKHTIAQVKMLPSFWEGLLEEPSKEWAFAARFSEGRKLRFSKRPFRHTLAPFSRFATVACARRGLYLVNCNTSRSLQRCPKCKRPKRRKSRNTLAFCRVSGANPKRVLITTWPGVLRPSGSCNLFFLPLLGEIQFEYYFKVVVIISLQVQFQNP